MNLIVNGDAKELDAHTLSDVIRLFGLAERPVILEWEGAVIPRERWNETALTPGGKLEIVQFIGGG